MNNVLDIHAFQTMQPRYTFERMYISSRNLTGIVIGNLIFNFEDLLHLLGGTGEIQFKKR